jgi:hypothetical protein
MNPIRAGGGGGASLHSSSGVSTNLSFSISPLKRQADGRLIAPVLSPTIDNQPMSPPPLQPSAQVQYHQQQVTLIEEEMAALQLVQKIEDEKAKASHLEWCLREILAERDVLLRQHEDEARRKRQEELQNLNRHLLHVSSPCVPSVASPGAATASPVPYLNPHARPRSTSAPPAMVTTPPALLSAGPPAASQPLRPQPHSLRIVRQHQLQLQQQQQQRHQQPFVFSATQSCEAARLLGLAPEAAGMTTDTLVTLDASSQYQGPVKRARLATSMPAASNQPNQQHSHHHLPRSTATVHHSAGVIPRQPQLMSVDANRFPSLHQHQQHQQHQHVCGGFNSTPGCESPVGCLPFGGTPPQCMQGAAAFAAAGSFSSSSASFDWTSSGATTPTSTTSTTAPATMTNDCATEWPLAGLNDEFDYDQLLDNLSAGL